MAENPIEELESLHAALEEADTEVSTLDSNIALIKQQLAILTQQRESIRKNYLRSKAALPTLERKVELYKEEQRIEEQILTKRQELLDLIDENKYPKPPKKYQIEGALQLAVAKRGICTDRRGLGKTLTAFLWRRMTKSKKTLIMTRNKYVPKMIRQFQFWEPDLTVINLAGMNKIERDFIYPMLSMTGDYTVVLNYEAWRKDKSLLNHLNEVGFDSVILDEIHNAKSLKTSVARGLLGFVPGIPNVLEMTGTLILNKPYEAWFPLHLLYPEIFPTEAAFKRDYCYGSGTDWYWKPGGLEQLAKILRPFYVSRTRTDVGNEIPPPDITYYPITFEGYPEQEQAYRLLTQRAMAKLESGKIFDMPSILSVLNRQRQMAVWPAGIVFKEKDEDPFSETYGAILGEYQFDVTESTKLDWTEDFIEGLIEEDENSRVVVFSNFKEPVWELQRRLEKKGIRVATYTAETTEAQAERIELDYDLMTAPEIPRYQVLLATYQSVGEALDLNAARDAILLDREWNPGREDQAIGRIDRMNNEFQARIHIPQLQNSVDLFMEDLIEHKRNVIAGYEEAIDLQKMVIDAYHDGKI